MPAPPPEASKPKETPVPPAAPTENPPEEPKFVQPVVAEADDDVLPKAESLAAVDVAKAKAEAATAAQAKPAEPELEPVIPKPEPPKPPKKRNRHRVGDDKSEKAAETTAPEKPQHDAPADKANKPEQKPADEPKPEGEPKPADQPKAEAEAGTGQMTGQVIMPTAAPAKTEPEVKQHESKPKKLAPGEVYVDESGNVVIGE
jgi:hypothetical protein